MRIHHFALTVKNLEKSISWYQKFFGVQVKHEYSDTAMKIVMMESDDIRIELFEIIDDGSPLPEYRKELLSDLKTMGAKHIALQVDDLDKWLKKAEGNNIEIVTKPDKAFYGGRWMFIKDLNGILIELVES